MRHKVLEGGSWIFFLLPSQTKLEPLLLLREESSRGYERGCLSSIVLVAAGPNLLVLQRPISVLEPHTSKR